MARKQTARDARTQPLQRSPPAGSQGSRSFFSPYKGAKSFPPPYAHEKAVGISPRVTPKKGADISGKDRHKKERHSTRRSP